MNAKQVNLAIDTAEHLLRLRNTIHDQAWPRPDTSQLDAREAFGELARAASDAARLANALSDEFDAALNENSNSR